MKNFNKELLLNKINNSEIVAFDVYGVLFDSIVNDQDAVYDLVGRHFGIHGFKRIRLGAQKEIEKIKTGVCVNPLANLDEIYGCIAEKYLPDTDCDAVKQYEAELTADALITDSEIAEIFLSAEKFGKKVIAVNNTCLSEKTVTEFIKEKGYSAVSEVCSTVPDAALYFCCGQNNISRENQNILCYKKEYNCDKLKNAVCSEIDNGIYRYLYNKEKGFWYNLGHEIGGPAYMGLYRFLKEKADKNQKIYVLSDGGYFIYEVLKNCGYKNVHILEIDGDILTDAVCKKELSDSNIIKYISGTGFFDEDAVCVDCDWEGTYQFLLEKIKASVNCKKEHFFYHIGIENSRKSMKKLNGCWYETYLFDFYKNYSLQISHIRNKEIYELFFKATDKKAEYYSEEGNPVYNNSFLDDNKRSILKGIVDFVRTGLGFADKYDVEFTPEISLGHLTRLITQPTEEELGNIEFLVKPVEDTRKYHLEDDRSIINYHRWLNAQKPEKTDVSSLEYNPFFSVVIPVYNTVTEQLEECINSVLNQTYHNFELILVDDHSSWKNVVPVLKKYENNSKVTVLYRETNGHISVATNDGINAAKGEFIVFMDCDDIVEPHALYEFARKLNDNPELDFIYSDEDKITEDGKIRHMPFFKPDWSPDLSHCMNYTNHLSAYRTDIVKAIGGLRTAYNGSQDYDFNLRFMEKSANSRVGHISKILYHWRERKESVAYSTNAKNYAINSARCAKEDYIRRNNIKAHLEYVTGISQYRIVYEVTGNPLVSIIIPSKDHPEILRQCIDSINKYTGYKNYEIIVVDNGSSDFNKSVIQNYLNDNEAVYIYEKAEFNFSKMCNQGAAAAKGEYLLFLNDDIEIFQPQWLERMLGHAQQDYIGAVGAKLYYPQTTKMQHAGVSNPIEGPRHNFLACDDRDAYYFGISWVDYNCIGVTGACLLLAADKFRDIGGFDEKLTVAYNDVKLCFELHKKGYYNVIRSDAVAYHHESLSRGNDFVTDKKLIRLGKERTHLFADFPELKGYDPFLNENMHTLVEILDMKQYFDEFSPIDITGCREGDMASIDNVSVLDKIRIIGWSALNGEKHMEKLDRYLVFEDPYGKTYGAKVLPYPRADVAQALGDECYKYAGFECVLRRCDLRLDIMPYRVGVLTVAGNGKRYINWCTDINVIRNPEPRPLVLDSNKIENFELHNRPEGIRCFIDGCGRYDGYYRIQGFAFKSGNDHHIYKNSVVLVSDNGEAFEFNVHLDERPDVAYSFPEEKFLYYTGFICYVFDNVLEKGHSYDIIIRLKNHFDENDIIDIPTNKKLELYYKDNI
ncbi:MAG: glycosyltransferase family 2 protein [Oscillospiraceae bacterium]|nr:glycosyltransferase family 2 protein [Oscillospiraceae bacterium]